MRLGVDFNILNQKGTPAFYSDVFANRPVAGFAGRVFISTDTGAIYEDTGTTWTLIADAGAGTTGTLQQVTTNGNTTTLGISVQGIGINSGAGTGTANTVLSNGGMTINTTGINNTAIGNNSLRNNKTGSNNIAIGVQSIYVNESGNHNVAIGYSSLFAGLSYINNTSIGSLSLANITTGDNNTALGYQAGNGLTSGSYNTIIGSYVGSGSMSNNVILADGQGNVRYQWNGTTNNFTGSISSSVLTTGSILFAGASGLLSESNATFFWDNTNKRLGIGNATPGAPLDIHATGTNAHFNGTGTNNAYLQFQNAGTNKWRIGNTYSAGANTFDLYNNGAASTALSFNSTTNNATFNGGIRTTGTADQQLWVYGSTPSLRLYDTTTSPTIVGFVGMATAANNFIQTSASGDMCIGSSTGGKILIGTASGTINPILSLTNTGAATFSSSVTAGAGSRLIVSGSMLLGEIISSYSTIESTSGNGIWLRPAGISSPSGMFVNTSGNVGIGTTSPSYLLDIQSTSATLRIRNTTAPTTGGTSSLLFEGINNFSGTSQSFINSIQAGASGATQLVFGTSGTTDATATERIRINSSGFLKASNTGSYLFPNSSFHEIRSNANNSNALIVSNSDASNPYILDLYMTGATPNNNTIHFIYCEDSTNNKFVVYSSGNAYNRTGTYGTISDVRLKENITNASPKLDDIMKLKVRNFNMIGDDKKQIGFIAQEFEEIFPAMVDENAVLGEDKIPTGEYNKAIKTSVLIPILVKAIQELNDKLVRNNIN